MSVAKYKANNSSSIGAECKRQKTQVLNKLKNIPELLGITSPASPAISCIMTSQHGWIIAERRHAPLPFTIK